MNKYNLINTFFSDKGDYINFLVSLKELTIANDEGTCFATLEKVDDYFKYQLTWLKDGKFIGDYIKPFRATKENLDMFNQGCETLAKRLEIYIETNDATKVPNDFPAFRELTEFR